MSEPIGTSARVLAGLVSSGLLTAEQVADAREAAAGRGVHVAAVLAERDLVGPLDIVSVLEQEMGVPQVDLSSYTPEAGALSLVSTSTARGRKVLPLFEIEGMLTVAVGDPMDVFMLDAVAAEIGRELEPVLADGASFAAALDQYYPREVPRADAPAADSRTTPASMSTEGPDAGDYASDDTPAVPVAPNADVLEPEVGSRVSEGIEHLAAAETASLSSGAIDLDVLAVADIRRVAVLVADILEDAVFRGATGIHLLPYKDDFFLVYRVRGGLEKVSSAPLALQGALVDGFKQYARLGGVSASRPALGRVRTRIGDSDHVLTVSVVPTIAGQRLVVTLSTPRAQPKDFGEIGIPEAETRALKAMVERGRGILLVCAPVAGGSSTTYYALLAHAASVGKTVYSVEQSIIHEIAAVAQVMIEPGGPSPAAYIAAGMRQDTDVIAVDGLRTVEDVHLAVEAAGLGKLVIATFPAADIASGVRRMLDLGAEPHSLAAALTVGVGQRLVRLNCPNCAMETDGATARRIPGAPAELRDKAGSGCPNCGKSGYRGATAIHEVLPFTEPVRAAVARAATHAELAAAAVAAGMRPLAVAGLARVTSGDVSAEELNRVLRFLE